MSAISNALILTERTALRQRRRSIRRHAWLYDRRRHLPGLIVLPREAMHLPEPELTRAIIARLKNELRRSSGLRARRHWTYSRYRHDALLAALGGELLRLRAYSLSSSG